MLRGFAAILWIGLTAGCSSGLETITDCREARGIRPICGFQNPEDLAPLEDGRTLIVSQFGSMDGERPGNLAFFDVSDEVLRVGYPAPGADREPSLDAEPGWGDESCPGPPGPEFSPHGIDLARRADGRLQLLVVNHGGRESVEFFEVTGESDAPALAWRGCAPPPAGAYFNDVVTLPGGGFLVTHMLDQDSRTLETLKAMMGMDTGWVYEWQPATGYRPVPGTEGAMPNGIEISPDGREIFLDLYGNDEVRRISRETGEILATAEVTRPDNVTWSRDGRLLVASHPAPIGDLLACGDLTQGSCPIEFRIVSLDPETLKGGSILENQGPPMGAGTVAIDLGDALYIGTFAGDRIARVTLPR